MSTATSNISPSTARTSLPWGWRICACSPRSVPLHRTRVVVLDEGAGDAARRVFPFVIALEEEAALVLEDVGLDQDHVGNRGGREAHG